MCAAIDLPRYAVSPFPPSPPPPRQSAMNNKVPFNQLRYGTRFKYREDDKQVFVRLGHDLVADWDGTLHAVACNLQGLYCFKDDTTPLDTPVCVIENADPEAV